jgi:hypothetical protein
LKLLEEPPLRLKMSLDVISRENCGVMKKYAVEAADRTVAISAGHDATVER